MPAASNLSIDRRSVLRGAVAASGGLLAAGLAGCASPGDPSSARRSTASAGSTPRRGGTLRLVAVGDPTSTLSPLLVSDAASYMALSQLYDSLVVQNGATFTNSLAETVEPNEDATTWTLRVRSGATFHNGRPVTAADVAYSLRAIGDPAQSPNYAAQYGDVDLAGLRVRDPRTLEVPLTRPRGDFRETCLSQFSFVWPEGISDADWATDVGSGPFRLTSTGSGGTEMTAYADHWGGAPLLDGASVVAVADPGARLDAVRSGQADYAVDVSPTGARSAARSGDVEIRKGGPGNSTARCFEMNTAQDPYTDTAVRRALKLLVDRQQLVDNVLLGQGSVGNDVFGLGLPGYDESLPQRTRDVDEARSLLKEAGVDGVTIKAADLISGSVDAAELLAEQAREAGLKVTVEKAAADTYFSDYATLLATPLQAFYFVNRPPSVMIGTYTGGRSSFNVTGVGGGDYDARLAEAQATADPAVREQRFDELQRYLWEDGGDLVWGFAEQADAVVPGLGGVVLAQSVPMLGKAYLPR